MMSEQKFWRQMQRNNYVYLYDEHGSPLSDHTEIPDHITELKNDPYRSLARAERELGGFKKTDSRCTQSPVIFFVISTRK